MSYIGIIGAKRLDDSNASLGLIEAQKKAVQLLRCSTDMHMIKQQTGWEMGVDGKWRYEVADPFHNTVEIEDHLKRHFGESINISLCMHDISLLIAYPAFERLSLYARYTPTNKFSGYFNPLSYGMMICMGTVNLRSNTRPKVCCCMRCSILYRRKRTLPVVETCHKAENGI